MPITSLKIDFGTSGSPLAPGYVRFGTTLYAATRGYGWVGNSGLAVVDTGFTDPLLRDCVRGKGGTFRIDVPDGRYRITLTLVDARQRTDAVTAVVSGQTVVTAPVLWSSTQTLTVDATGGRVELVLSASGPSTPYFGLAALTVEALTVVPPLVVDAGPAIASSQHDVTFTPVISGGQPPYVESWDYGDGQTGTARTHRYDSNDTYTATLTVTDSKGLTVTDSVQVTVEHIHHPPPTPEGGFLVIRHANNSVDRIPIPTEQVIDSVLVIDRDTTLGEVHLKSGGKLEHRSGTLTIDYLLVNGGEYEQASGAWLVTRDRPIDTVRDPQQWGRGLVGVSGKVVLASSPKTSFVRLAAEALAGQTQLLLATPALGWRAGDTLVLPDTRHLSLAESTGYVWKGEVCTVESVSVDGFTVNLVTPLRYDHKDAFPYKPHVMNVTRAGGIRSENPLGTRGHIAFLGDCQVDLGNAALIGLGRTTNEEVDETTFDEQGNVTHIGTNQPARYACHRHHHTGTFRMTDCAVYDLTENHRVKWPITIHASNDGLIKGNVVYNYAGSGIVTEDGSETGNIIDGNFVLRCRGSHGWGTPLGGALYLPYHQPGGIWLAGSRNYIRNNVVANVHEDQFIGSGYVYMGKWKGNIAEPILEFAGNEAYGATTCGLAIWNLGTTADTASEIPGMAESVFKDFRFWNCHYYGVFTYDVNRLTFDGLVGRGMVLSTGFLGEGYTMFHTRFVNCDLQGLACGIQPGNLNDEDFVVQDSYLDCLVGVQVPELYLAVPEGTPIQLPPRKVLLNNVTYGSLGVKVRMVRKDGTAVDRTTSDVVEIRKHDGVVGEDYRLYYDGRQPAGAVQLDRVDGWAVRS